MKTCAACGASVPVGQRWCDVCHHDRFRPGPGDLASPARRLAAFLVDESIPFVALVSIATGALLAHSILLLFVLFMGFAVWAFTLFARGMTPGKLTMGIQVVKADGRPADFFTMLVRETFGKFISGLVFMMGWIWILIDKEHQGWHDKLVGTYVIRRSVEAAPDPMSLNGSVLTPTPVAPPAATEPIERRGSPGEGGLVPPQFAYCTACGGRGVVGRYCSSCGMLVE